MAKTLYPKEAPFWGLGCGAFIAGGWNSEGSRSPGLFQSFRTFLWSTYSAPRSGWMEYIHEQRQQNFCLPVVQLACLPPGPYLSSPGAGRLA